MIHLITELSKYVMIILFAIYTWYSYVVLAVRNEERQKRMYKTQTTCMFLIHLDAFMVLFAVTKELKVLIFLWRAGAVCAVFVPNLPDYL